jgi:hypothetical protein
MTWHTLPKDDAWRLVTPLSVEALGNRLWLRCNACGHDLIVPAVEWCTSRHLRADMPLLLIARRLRCERCGERKAHCWPEPHDSLQARMGLRAAPAGEGATSRHEHSGRQGAIEFVLARLVRETPLPRSRNLLRRAQGSDAGNLALVRAERRGTPASVRLRRSVAQATAPRSNSTSIPS